MKKLLHRIITPEDSDLHIIFLVEEMGMLCLKNEWGIFQVLARANTRAVFNLRKSLLKKLLLNC